MKPAAIGRILLWRGGSLWIGLAGEPTGSHAHHAVQISLPFPQEIAMLAAAYERRARERSARIAVSFKCQPRSVDRVALVQSPNHRSIQ